MLAHVLHVAREASRLARQASRGKARKEDSKRVVHCCRKMDSRDQRGVGIPPLMQKYTPPDM